MSAEPQKDKRLYKIVFIGNPGTRKESIIHRYVCQSCSSHCQATIGVDYVEKVLNWDNNTTIRLVLWDVASQERFVSLLRGYYRNAVGAFVVFDVTRHDTFEAVQMWKKGLDDVVRLPNGKPIPAVLLANRIDPTGESFLDNINQLDEYCKGAGFEGWFETSVKENTGIEEAVRFLVSKILLNDNTAEHSSAGSDVIHLGGDDHPSGGAPSGGKFCC